MTAFVAVLRRLGIALATLFAIVSLSWLVASVLPGDPARLVAGPQATERDVAAIRHSQGLDRPIGARFAIFLEHLLHVGPRHPNPKTDPEHRSCAEILPHVHVDLGFSYGEQKPVTELVAARAPVSFWLAIWAFAFQIVAGTVLGLWSAARPGSRRDRVVSALVMVLATVPSFVVGLALQYVFAHRLALLPLDGLGTTPSARVLGFVLPVVTLGIYGSALFSRIVREELRSVLRSDFIRTARARGASVPRVLFVHALRAAIAPIATLAVLDLGALIGGAVVVERLFRLRGLGDLAVTAIQNRDAPLVTGTVLVASAATIAATLAADILAVWLDPTKRR